MAYQSPDPDAAADLDPAATTGPPRWVKVSAAIALVVVVLFVVLKLTGVGGDHGPGRHTGGGGETTPASVGEHKRPAGDHGP